MTSTTATLKIPERERSLGSKLLWLIMTAVVVAAFWGLNIDWKRLGQLPAQLGTYTWLMFSAPDWSKTGEALLQTLRSVEMAWIGTVFGAIIALPLSLLASRGYAPLPVRGVLRALFSLIRAVPEVVIAIILLTITGLTPFTGALALMVTSVGTLGKWGYEAVENADRGPIEAVRSAGGTTWQVLRWGVWPDISSTFVSFWLYRFEVNIRASAVLGLIGAGGVGDMMSSYVQYREWSVIGLLLIVVVVVTIAIDTISGYLRHRIIQG